jgi:hypothetical protein
MIPAKDKYASDKCLNEDKSKKYVSLLSEVKNRQIIPKIKLL